MSRSPLEPAALRLCDEVLRVADAMPRCWASEKLREVVSDARTPPAPDLSELEREYLEACYACDTAQSNHVGVSVVSAAWMRSHSAFKALSAARTRSEPDLSVQREAFQNWWEDFLSENLSKPIPTGDVAWRAWQAAHSEALAERTRRG